MNRKQHWEGAFQRHAPTEVSWYQSRPAMSMALIADTGTPRGSRIIDVGGGASTLVDFLLDAGYTAVAVLDVSGTALNHVRRRLGARSTRVEWFEADVTAFVSPHLFVVWHDRAVFHFLTSPADRSDYAATLRRSLEPGGHVIIGTFGPDGPLKCSGLDVVRYDASSLAAALGPEFVLRDSRRETHLTPAESGQEFQWCRFQYKPVQTSGAVPGPASR